MDGPDVDSLVGTTNVATPISLKAETTSHLCLDEKHSLTFVILFRATNEGAGVQQLERLIRRLDRVSLNVECRYGDTESLLIFVRCPNDTLHALVAKERYQRQMLI
jgi:hypothetical protein